MKIDLSCEPRARWARTVQVALSTPPERAEMAFPLPTVF
jgi:hypothetical protein